MNPSGPEFETFVGDDKKHYWRLVAANGQVIATGGEGYETKAGVYRAIGGVQRAVLSIVGDAAGGQAEQAAVLAEQELAQA
jgi:uncharacterized protein YegP (UPF0339 family)